MQKPIVSIIIPTLNEEKFITQTLKALATQDISRSMYEIIVSDSSSDDTTVALAKKLADKVVICKRVSGGFGRNFGAQHARGKYMAFVDADTIVEPTWVRGVIEGLDKGIACTGPMRALEKDALDLRIFLRIWSIQSRVSVFFRYPIFPGFNMAVRKNEFNAEKGFNPHITVEDVDLSLRLRKKGKVIFSNKMKVHTSIRRFKEIGLWKYMLNVTRFILFRKSWSWSEHRKDIPRK